ncbi:T9SS type A sorting domain-containing protein [Pontibacter sp. MBLB2868]|uniref:T9SS type A sorting domain-containing protein n=1 Tax=Pontibacter sp. MBLB2868 TaxID=3451555 RepID=UPI003F74DEA1
MIKHLQKVAALALLGGLVLAGSNASAQVTLTNLTYSQNFDGIGATGTTLPEGWTAVRYAGTGTAGATLTPVVSDGSANSGAIYNVGTTDATDRAIGSVSSTSTNVRFGAGFTNGTTSTIGTVAFAATMEQWRTGSLATTDETTAFMYSLNASGINDEAATWTALTSMDLVEILKSATDNAAVDGNAAANKIGIAGTISNLTLAPNETLWIRWSDPNDSGSDGLYAIDDFSMTLTAATTTGIADATKGMFSIYPNPMQNQNVRLSLPGHVAGQNVTLTVWSVEGKVIFQSAGSQSNVQQSLNEKMTSLPKGMFFVNVAAGKEIYQTKLLKN